MNKFATLLVTTAAIAIASPTLAADPVDLKSQASMQQRANGGYEKHAIAEKTTASGHERAETTVTLDVDDNGNKEKVTTTEEVNDPKGLMNKQTVKTETKEMVKDGKITVESQKKINGDTVSKTKKSW